MSDHPDPLDETQCDLDAAAGFRLVRRLDGLSYRFLPDACGRFFREDRPDLTIHRDGGLGWIAGNVAGGPVTGMVWGMPAGLQPTIAPPAGPWVSQKEGRSYIYDLIPGAGAEPAFAPRLDQLAGCPFCDIAAGQAEAAIIQTTPTLIAFADHAPIRPGHIQIIPRTHVETFEQLPDGLAGEIVGLGQRIARVLKRHFGVIRVGFVFTGNEVAHVHAHLIPLHEATDVTSLRFFEIEPEDVPRRDCRISLGELNATAADLRAALAQDAAEV